LKQNSFQRIKSSRRFFSRTDLSLQKSKAAHFPSWISEKSSYRSVNANLTIPFRIPSSTALFCLLMCLVEYKGMFSLRKPSIERGEVYRKLMRDNCREFREAQKCRRAEGQPKMECERPDPAASQSLYWLFVASSIQPCIFLGVFFVLYHK